jgi:hypothetical protein
MWSILIEGKKCNMFIHLVGASFIRTSLRRMDLGQKIVVGFQRELVNMFIFSEVVNAPNDTTKQPWQCFLYVP